MVFSPALAATMTGEERVVTPGGAALLGESPEEETPVPELEASGGLLETPSGSLGDSVTWSLDTATGVLTVAGRGGIPDYTDADRAPWYPDYKDQIKSLVIEYGITAIGNHAFQGCPNLAQISFPGGVSRIGQYAFYDCDALSSVTISKGTNTMEDRAFAFCDNLTSVSLPSDMYTIGAAPFANCPKLQSITVPEGNSSYCSVEGVLMDAYKTCLIQYPVGSPRQSYRVPEKVKIIKEYAFAGSNLTSVTLGSNLTTIRTGAFINSAALTEVSLPESVTAVETLAFGGCTALDTVAIPSETASIAADAFDQCSAIADVYYGDTQAVRDSSITSHELLAGTWHYNCDVRLLAAPCFGGRVVLPPAMTREQSVAVTATPDPGYTLLGLYADFGTIRDGVLTAPSDWSGTITVHATFAKARPEAAVVNLASAAKAFNGRFTAMGNCVFTVRGL